MFTVYTCTTTTTVIIVVVLQSCCVICAAQQPWFNGAPCAAQHNLQPPTFVHGVGANNNEKAPYQFYFLDNNGRSTERYTPNNVYTGSKLI